MSDRRTPGSPGSPGSPGIARKLITPVMLFLLLITGGAIVNIAVAWGCAAWVNPELTAPTFSVMTVSPDAHDVVSTLHRFGHSRINQARFSGITEHADGGVTLSLQRSDGRHHSEMLTGWPARSLSAINHAEVMIHTSSDLYGSFRSGLGGMVGAIEISRFVGGTTGGTWRALPVQPRWPGFAINTLFYAAILWLLFAAPFALRRHLRLKRGLCPACAYPVGTSDLCTECGKPVKAEPATHGAT